MTQKRRPREYDEDHRAYVAAQMGVAAPHEMDAELGVDRLGCTSRVPWFEAWCSAHTFTVAAIDERPPGTIYVSIDEYATIRHEWVLITHGSECATETRTLLGRACAAVKQTAENASVQLLAAGNDLPARAAYVMIDRTIEYLTILRKQVRTGWTYSERGELLRFLLEQPYEERWYNFRRWVKDASERDIKPEETT